MAIHLTLACDANDDNDVACQNEISMTLTPLAQQLAAITAAAGWSIDGDRLFCPDHSVPAPDPHQAQNPLTSPALTPDPPDSSDS